MFLVLEVKIKTARINNYINFSVYTWSVTVNYFSQWKWEGRYYIQADPRLRQISILCEVSQPTLLNMLTSEAVQNALASRYSMRIGRHSTQSIFSLHFSRPRDYCCLLRMGLVREQYELAKYGHEKFCNLGEFELRLTDKIQPLPYHQDKISSCTRTRQPRYSSIIYISHWSHSKSLSL